MSWNIMNALTFQCSWLTSMNNLFYTFQVGSLQVALWYNLWSNSGITCGMSTISCRYCVTSHSLSWTLCNAMVWHAFSCLVSEIILIKSKMFVLSALLRHVRLLIRSWVSLLGFLYGVGKYFEQGNHLQAKIHRSLQLTKKQCHFYS